MRTKKQNRLESMEMQLETLGLAPKDRKKFCRLIDNGDLFRLENRYLNSILDQTALLRQDKCALRRTFGKNALIFGPTGYAIVERHEILYVFPYVNSSFEQLTRIYSDFVCYYGDDVNTFVEERLLKAA